MKKFLICLALVLAIFVWIGHFQTTLADSVNINIAPPAQGVNPNADTGKVIGNVISIIFVVATLAVLFMLILGAFQYITSGGDKEGAGKAQKRITNAIIGLVILAVAFLLIKLIGGIVNVNILNLHLPSLDEGATNTTTSTTGCPTGQSPDPITHVCH